MPEGEGQNSAELPGVDKSSGEEVSKEKSQNNKEMPEGGEHTEDDIQLSVEDEEEMLINEDRGEEQETSKDEEKTKEMSGEKDEDNDAKSCASEAGNTEEIDPLQYIWVSNLDLEIKSDTLRKMFSKYGTVLKAKMMLDYNSINVKVCGFVKMSSKEEAQKALIEVPKLYAPPNGINCKLIEDTEMIKKIESLKSSKISSSKKTSAKSKGNPDDKEEGNEALKEHKENGGESDSKSSPKKATRSVFPSRPSMRHHSSYSTLRGDRVPGGYGPRPFRRHPYQDLLPPPRRSFLFGWREEERRRLYEKIRREEEEMEIREKRILLRKEHEKIMKSRLELLNMKKEISRLIKEDTENKRQRLAGTKRPYPKDDEWESKKKPAVSSYYADESRSSHSRYGYAHDRYSSSRKLAHDVGASYKSPDWDSSPTNNREQISPIYISSTHDAAVSSSYSHSNYTRPTQRDY